MINSCLCSDMQKFDNIRKKEKKDNFIEVLGNKYRRNDKLIKYKFYN